MLIIPMSLLTLTMLGMVLSIDSPPGNVRVL
jgi:hypothetical protein